MNNLESDRARTNFWQRRHAARMGRLYVQLAVSHVFSGLFEGSNGDLNCSTS
jgi:hypothetical protein